MKKLIALLLLVSMIASLMCFEIFAKSEVIFQDSFEDGPAKWVYNSNRSKEENTKISKDMASDGSCAAYIYDADTSTYGYRSVQIPAVAGMEYTVSYDAFNKEGMGAKIFIEFYGKDKKRISSTSFGTTAVGEWKSLTKTVTAPEGVSYICLNLTGSGASTGLTYIDNVKVTSDAGTGATSSSTPSSGTASSSSQPAAATGNTLISESFEGDFSSGWTYKNDYAKSNITIVNDASNGKKALQFNDDSSSESPALQSKRYTVNAGDVIEVSTDFKAIEGKKISAYIRFYNKEGKTMDGGGSITATSNSWATSTKSFTAPSGVVSFQVLLTGNVAGEGICLIDNVKAIITSKGAVSETPAETPAEKPAETPVVTNVEPLPQASGNVLIAESFEGEKPTWKTTGITPSTTATVVTKDAYDGKKSIYIADDSDTGTPGVIFPKVTVKEGEGFELKAFIKYDVGTLMKIWYKFYDQAGTRISSANFGASGSGWMEATKVFFAPEGAASLEISFTTASTSIASSYVDRLTVTRLSDDAADEIRPVTLDKPEVIEGIPTDSDKFHIYLCLGQSNMVGADTVKNEDIVKVNGAYLLNSDSKWEVAQPYTMASDEYLGFNRYSTVGQGTGKTGPTIGFARGMVTKVPEGVKIGIISNAKGGTTIDEWSKGYEGTEDLDLYEKAVSRTKEALAKGGVLKGIFWLQGESCASKEGYMDKLVKVANGLREELGVKNADVPFFVTEVPYVRAGAVKTLQTAPQFIENSFVVSCEGLTIFDSIHLDAVSQRKLGLRYAEIALSKIYGITASADDMFKEIYGDVKQEVKPDDTVYTILVNGQKLESDVPPTMAGDRLFVPIRVIFETLGATVSWDDPTQTVTGVRGDRTVIMQIGDEHMTVNGVRSKMGVAPMLKDSRTLVPIRFVGEGLGAEVGWDEKTNTASITLK